MEGTPIPNNVRNVFARRDLVENTVKNKSNLKVSVPDNYNVFR